MSIWISTLHSAHVIPLLGFQSLCSEFYSLDSGVYSLKVCIILRGILGSTFSIPLFKPLGFRIPFPWYWIPKLTKSWIAVPQNYTNTYRTNPLSLSFLAHICQNKLSQRHVYPRPWALHFPWLPQMRFAVCCVVKPLPSVKTSEGFANKYKSNSMSWWRQFQVISCWSAVVLWLSHIVESFLIVFRITLRFQPWL